uniref:Uncharacterized protein n=1 Tax=Tanacetum cinerariifolium TaxID=118510 RepID=A0A699J396_TANCI|nr:hypothetical protein [Tanacetum cinerariifolium]
MKGVGLRMVDSRTGNHPEDDFTPLKTIQRLCSVFGRRSYLGFEGRPPSRRGGYIIKPPGKLTTFAIMCRAYGCESTVNLLCSFLNLGCAGDWLTLSNREIDFRSFMMQEINGEFKFLPEGCIDDNQCSPSLKSVNNKASIIDAKPLTSVHPSNFVEDVADSDDASPGDNENPLVGTSLPLYLRHVLKMAAQASKVAGEAFDPLDVDSDLDIHVVLDNVLNTRTRELIFALHKATASCDAIRARELKKDIDYAELERKCNEALFDMDKNPLVADMRTKIETL